MKKEQVLKILITMIIATAIMFAFDIFFSIDSVSNAISRWIISLQNLKWIMWAAIWLIMFVQVCFIPIPAVVVIQAAMSVKVIQPELGVIGMFGTLDLWLFVIITMTAYMAGAVVAYFMGKKWGKKAVRWCAGSDEDYDKWPNVLTQKGKWWYAASVILPVFPDDLLCLVCGSVKFDFHFFFWSNLVGRSVGLLTMLGALAIVNGGGGHLSLIAWGVALVGEIIAYFVIKNYKKKENKEN